MFETKKFKEACNTSKQNPIFFRVNSHHQNVKAENIIKYVTTGTITALHHADHHWPNAIYDSLWPAFINNYANLINSIPTNFKPETYHGRNKISATYDSSPLSILSVSKVEANLDHFHPFVSPFYVLKNLFDMVNLTTSG